MSTARQRSRYIAEAKARRRGYKVADERRRKGMAEEAPGQNDPLFAAFKQVTDTRHIFTYLASPFVADKNKPVSLYIAKRVADAVKVNYSDLFFSSLTNVYWYMLYQDFHDYMTNICGVPLDETNLKDCFHEVYFPRFQNTEVYTRLWPKLGQHLEDSDGDLDC